jgi:hypothetical protein
MKPNIKIKLPHKVYTEKTKHNSKSLSIQLSAKLKNNVLKPEKQRIAIDAECSMWLCSARIIS